MVNYNYYVRALRIVIMHGSCGCCYPMIQIVVWIVPGTTDLLPGGEAACIRLQCPSPTHPRTHTHTHTSKFHQHIKLIKIQQKLLPYHMIELITENNLFCPPSKEHKALPAPKSEPTRVSEMQGSYISENVHTKLTN